MKNKDLKIHIIGAGVSGLIAAKTLEENGFSPVIIEATDSVGGRVKTDIVDGYQLDHGFQVLLTAYPAVKKFLDIETLQLQKFLPGASLFIDGKQKIIGDPLRNTSLLIPTLFSNAIPIKDKFKILKLNNRLKKKDLTTIFSENEQTTFAFLEDFGFSEKTIERFFKPFFSGIFLEPNLDTSSRMFSFIYKMFGEGYATLPKAGIGEIPKQLANKLTKTKILFNTEVTSISNEEITLKNQEKITSDFTIVATEASKLIPNLSNQSPIWKKCNTLYYEVDKPTIVKPLIGLITDSKTVINSIFYHTSLATTQNAGKALLSVTVVDNKSLNNEQLITRVKNELSTHCGIHNLRFIKQYDIPLALPHLENIQFSLTPSETRLTSNIFLAGDTLLNGSLNAAMLSGEAAALGIIEGLSSSIIG